MVRRKPHVHGDGIADDIAASPLGAAGDSLPLATDGAVVPAAVDVAPSAVDVAPTSVTMTASTPGASDAVSGPPPAQPSAVAVESPSARSSATEAPTPCPPAEAGAAPADHASAGRGLVATSEAVAVGAGFDRLAAARALVQTHTLVSAGAGFIPGVGVDVAAMSASQLWLLRRLSALYGVEFREDIARKLVAAALAGFVPLQIVSPVAGMFKMIPVVGSMLGGLSMAAAGGAITYAIGLAFVQHFESGGTLLTFDPRRVRRHFAAEHAREVASATMAHGR